MAKIVCILVIFLHSFSSFASKIKLEITRSWYSQTISKRTFSEEVVIPIGKFWTLSDQKDSTFAYKLKVDTPHPKENNLHTIKVKVLEKRGNVKLERSNASIVVKMNNNGFVSTEDNEGGFWELIIRPIKIY